ncbi:hypothetical protein [Streptomyces sp. NPDC058412]|uniref:hypothetical protein n=1 Tax=Streptomyces sp. NPDC058412 TaxID=3346486 RepID=UPI003655782A
MSFGSKDLFSFDGAPGDLRVMPYNDGRHMTVKVIGTNEARTEVPDKISVGKCLLVHPQDHHVMGILDVAALSSLRTAVGILLAWRAAHPGAVPGPRLGIVGAGRVGFYTAPAFQRTGLIDSCAVYDPAPGAVGRLREPCRLEAARRPARRRLLPRRQPTVLRPRRPQALAADRPPAPGRGHLPPPGPGRTAPARRRGNLLHLHRLPAARPCRSHPRVRGRHRPRAGPAPHAHPPHRPHRPLSSRRRLPFAFGVPARCEHSLPPRP